jgi:hypothetical protein
MYPLAGRVEMLVQQVQFDELIDQPQVIRRKLGSFFKRLARFVISLGLATGQAERSVGLWILWSEPCLVANDRFGIVEPIQRAIRGGQDEGGGPQIGPFSITISP